ncbi:MAG: PucR family transcriptional regulator [Nocardioidaceae bacterium]|nr:PucR family transcriptional regulator [Nocardioidaceae bacterium]
MAVPTVASLCRTLGTDLAPAPGFDAPAREVTAVHVSELADPTPYLTGGELLLTTGLALPRSRLAVERYVGRLVEADVSALAFGLGPVHAEVPATLSAACATLGLPLLVVPAPTPFQVITRSYWTAVSRSAEQQLKDVLVAQRSLVEAASSADPVPAVLRTLSRSLDAWAARLGPRGEVEVVVPAGARDRAEQVRADVARLQGAGVHSSASFATGTDAVVVYPLAVEENVAGFLAVGTATALDGDRRRAVLTASALLSLDAMRATESAASALELQRCVGLLATTGYVDAARSLAASVGTPLPPARVRVLALTGREIGPLVAAAQRWCGEAVAVRTDRRSGWLLVPAEHPPTATLARALRRQDDQATAVLSETVPVERADAVRGLAVAAAAGAAPGHLDLTGPAAPGDDAFAGLGDALDDLDADLTATLAGYLRRHGHVEAAARDLDLHRNTVRQRVARIAAALDADLDDPDVTARLWLLLRRRGAA